MDSPLLERCRARLVLPRAGLGGQGRASAMAGQGLMQAGAGPWEGMLFVGGEESPSGVQESCGGVLL